MQELMILDQFLIGVPEELAQGEKARIIAASCGPG